MGDYVLHCHSTKKEEDLRQRAEELEKQDYMLNQYLNENFDVLFHSERKLLIEIKKIVKLVDALRQKDVYPEAEYPKKINKLGNEIFEFKDYLEGLLEKEEKEEKGGRKRT